MPRWSHSDRARIERRRMLVEQMDARGMDLYEIAANLADQLINPDTGDPYDISTISRDLSEIEKRWRDKTVQERAKHKSRQLMELRTARRAAWKEHQYAEVRRNLEAEMRLLGTDEPIGIEHSGGVSVAYINDWRD